MKVYWKPCNESGHSGFSWVHVAYGEPEPVYKNLITSRNKEVSYFKCPAVQQYFKNTFLIRAPIDLTITVEDGIVKTYQYDQEVHDFLMDRKTKHGLDKYETLAVSFNYLFYSDEPCLMEQLPAFMEDSDFPRSVRVIPGTFDISKWVRPIEVSFEVADTSKAIHLKRGDPLCYVRLIPSDDSRVTLERVEESDDLRRLVHACVTLKSVIRNNSLKENYELAKSYITLWRNGRKKNSRCPFHFWK